jgi:3-methyl-2-oxobutanoate hydroxymethyltransferase
VLVNNDHVNLPSGHPAKVVRRNADLGEAIPGAVQAFRADVSTHQYPADEESYHLPKETRAALVTVLERKRAMRR